uniref:Uncharacterized protein n=1 Tax=Timema cristinae TaxID=61476 RepID=A0A7R9GWH8_TIMCR|nr:unnamed protein product [Timema cristinae]
MSLLFSLKCEHSTLTVDSHVRCKTRAVLRFGHVTALNQSQVRLASVEPHCSSRNNFNLSSASTENQPRRPDKRMRKLSNMRYLQTHNILKMAYLKVTCVDCNILLTFQCIMGKQRFPTLHEHHEIETLNNSTFKFDCNWLQMLTQLIEDHQSATRPEDVTVLGEWMKERDDLRLAEDKILPVASRSCDLALSTSASKTLAKYISNVPQEKRVKNRLDYGSTAIEAAHSVYPERLLSTLGAGEDRWSTHVKEKGKRMVGGQIMFVESKLMATLSSAGSQNLCSVANSRRVSLVSYQQMIPNKVSVLALQTTL